MAKFNLNKTEKIKSKTTIAWKLIALEIILNKNQNPPFLAKIYLYFVKYKNFEARFTS